MGEAGIAEHILVGDGASLEDYWSQCKASSWYAAHPGKDKVERSPRQCVALRIWGDDAEATNNHSMYCLSVSSVTMLHLTSLLSRVLVFGVTTGRFVNL